MKLTINGYEVEIIATADGSGNTAATMVFLDTIASACNTASLRMKERGCENLSKQYGNIAVDIFSALSDAGKYTA